MKQIAEIRSERKDVEKKEAIAEESIKDLRVKSEADRNKTAIIINAEAEAQQSLVVTIKAAEAQEEVAKFKARQRLVEADAALDAADREAKAKIRQAEGSQAESAAEVWPPCASRRRGPGHREARHDRGQGPA